MNGPMHSSPPPRSADITFIAAMAVYFSLQVAVRLVGFPALGRDERELVYLSSVLEWGRGGQPPLYSWLQWAAFQLLGVNLFALSVIKNLILFLTVLGSYLTARRIFGAPGLAAIATLLLFTIPQFGWESQRALSHTVLVVCVAAWAIYVFVRIAETGANPLLSIAFGALCGLGTLSKYNFLILSSSLLLAALFDPQCRRQVFRPALLLAIPAFLLICTPHGLWALSHMDEVLSRVSKFEIDDEASLYMSPLLAIWGVLVGTVFFLVLPALLILPVLFFPKRQPVEPTLNEEQAKRLGALLLRTIVVALVLIVVGMALARGTSFKDRWLQPLLFSFPLGMVAVYGLRLSQIRRRLLAGFGIACALVAFFGLAFLQIRASLEGQVGVGTEPYIAHAQAIKELGFLQGGIIAPASVAGNLKMLFPSSAILMTGHADRYQRAPTDQILLAWEGEEAARPAEVDATLAEYCGPTLTTNARPVDLSAPYRGNAEAIHHLNVVILPACPPASSP